jgi:hypothetical protein
MDIDPSYLYFDFIPERIYNIMGAHVKFIVILRDPAIRAYSHYLMEISRQNETQTFEKAISMEESRIKSMSGNLLFSYINRGLYARQIERYLQYFPLEKFKFFIFEDDFLLNKNAMLESICSFMDIKYNHDYFPKNIKANYTRKPIIRSIDQILKGGFVKIPFLKKNTLYKSVTRAISNKLIWLNTSKNVQKLSEELRRKLIKIYFLEDIQKLEKLINRDLSSWTSGVESS